VVTGRTALIAVNGEPALCSLLVDLLSDAGFTTRAVPDLGIALELARSVDFVIAAVCNWLRRVMIVPPWLNA
jgi:DNA-binding response OmpR family regulator